jgi:putative hydrolase
MEREYLLEADLHTHTVASADAYCTVLEMTAGAARKGLDLIGITDHGPQASYGASIHHFGNMAVWPRQMNGVRVLRGVEANIIDLEGNLDLPTRLLEQLDLVVAGLHTDAGYSYNSVEDNTRAVVAAIRNPYVHIISHPGNPEYPVDLDKVALAAKVYDKVLELNNKSFTQRPGSAPRCQHLAKLAKRHQLVVAVDSDAHFVDDVGECDIALQMAAAADLGPEQILNASAVRVMEYLNRHRHQRKVMQSTASVIEVA